MTEHDKENFDDNPQLVAEIAREAFAKAAREAARFGYASYRDENNVLHVRMDGQPARTVQLNWKKVDRTKTYKLKTPNLVSEQSVFENPSPSGDPYFLVPENLQAIREGMDEIERGEGKAYTLEELRIHMGLSCQKSLLTSFLEHTANGYVVRCPELDIASQGETIEEAEANLREAIDLFWECASEQEIQNRLDKIKHERTSSLVRENGLLIFTGKALPEVFINAVEDAREARIQEVMALCNL